MTKADPIRLIQQATEEDSLLPLGEYACREDNGGWKVRYPTPAAEFNNIDADSSFKLYFDQDTGAMVVIPADDSTE